MNRITYYVFSVCLLVGFLGIKAENNFSESADTKAYRVIGDSYLRSFGIHDSGDNLDDEAALTIVEMDKYEKLRLLFSLLATGKSCSNYEMDVRVGTLLEDLEVLYGQGDDHSAHIFSKINYTNTVFGEIMLAHMLAHPLVDISTLQKRQALVRELIENEQLFNELDRKLNQLKQAEPAIFSFWGEENPVSDALVNKLYFNKRFFKRFNNNTIALEMLVRLGNVSTALTSGGDIFLGIGLNYLMHKKGIGGLAPISFKDAMLDTFKNIINIYNPQRLFEDYRKLNSKEFSEEFESNIRQVYQKSNVEITDEQLQSFKKVAKKAGYISLGLTTALVGGYTVWRGLAIKTAVSEANQVRNTTNYLQQRLIGVAELIRCFDYVHELAHENTAINEGLLLHDNITTLCEESKKRTDLAKLINLLRTNTFKNHASFFSLSGRVLAAHNLMCAQKDKLIGAMEAIGEIDACLSIAKLYKQFEGKRVSYSFVEYVENDKPYLHLDAFWNPIVNHDVVIPNDAVLGEFNGAHNIILTGSNTGGKSTILKGIVLNILCAQTLGIAPANCVVLTPFKNICTYLNIKDDTAGGKSAFKVEVLRAQSLIQAVETLPENEFAFLVIDELFKGTSSDKAQDAACNVVAHLAHHKNVCFILATHHSKLTLLAQHCEGLKNCKIDVFKDETGSLIRPFKLEDGISENNVAQDILQAELESIDFNNLTVAQAIG